MEGYSMLAEVADAWQVAELTGAPLSTALEAVSVRFAAFAKLRQLVDAEVSSARATGKLLAALPLVGIGLGYAMGGDPLGFLTGSVFGQAVLALGACLASAGLVWVEKVADVPAQ
jgi:tight adherence protein B